MTLIRDLKQLRDMYRSGPSQFFAWTAAFLLVFGPYIAVQIWLENRLGWPENYGFYCRRKCFFDNLANSPKLLQTGDPYEIGLFAAFWFLPAIIAFVFAYIFIASRRRDRNPIQPLEYSE